MRGEFLGRSGTHAFQPRRSAQDSHPKAYLCTSSGARTRRSPDSKAEYRGPEPRRTLTRRHRPAASAASIASIPDLATSPKLRGGLNATGRPHGGVDEVVLLDGTVFLRVSVYGRDNATPSGTGRLNATRRQDRVNATPRFAGSRIHSVFSPTCSCCKWRRTRRLSFGIIRGRGERYNGCGELRRA